ncbi:MAG: hypothetical protein Q8P67_27705 [archaeon]|nr:hypothetical protein [archaeon]
MLGACSSQKRTTPWCASAAWAKLPRHPNPSGGRRPLERCTEMTTSLG